MFAFIETKLFTRLFDEIFSDDDLAQLQDFLRESPEAGAVVSGVDEPPKIEPKKPPTELPELADAEGAGGAMAANGAVGGGVLAAVALGLATATVRAGAGSPCSGSPASR